MVDNATDLTPKITPAQAEVLHLLTEVFLPVKEVASRRGASRQAVWKIIRALKQKGYLKGDARNGFIKSKSTPQLQSTTLLKNAKKYIRLHGQEFSIKILHKNKRYDGLIKKSNLTNIDGNTIRLYKESIEIYGNQNKFFVGKTVQEVTSKSFNYWNNLFPKIENRLGIIFLKEGYLNIKLVNSHYAEVENELARECNRQNEKIKIYSPMDGKVWFLIDFSLNLHEAETKHPETAKRDMETVIVPYFDDLRNNPSIPLPSQQWNIVQEFVQENIKFMQTQERYMQAQGEYAVHIQSHISAIQTLSKKVEEFANAVNLYNEKISKQGEG